MNRVVSSMGVVLLLMFVFGCSKKTPSASETPAAPAGTSSKPEPAGRASEMPPTQQVATSNIEGTGVFINDRELSAQQMIALTATYRYAPPRGRFWYDTVSGAWGAEGRETIGFILPGYDLGPLSPDASAGNTGVFINGREISTVEAAGLQRTFGAVYQGRWWLDGRTGNYGVEGNPMPMGNILAALRAQGRGGSGSDNFWSSATARGNSSGGCSYVSVGGTTATSGCD